MERAQKVAFVADFNSKIGQMGSVVVGHYRGLSVVEMEELRKELLKNDGELKVAKNRLVKIALKGTPYENLEEFLEGPTAIAMSQDPVVAAKFAHKFAKANEHFEIIGGALGDKKLDKAGVEALASMPSLDELRGKLVGLISAPATKIATIAKEPASMVARVMSARGEQAA